MCMNMKYYKILFPLCLLDSYSRRYNVILQIISKHLYEQYNTYIVIKVSSHFQVVMCRGVFSMTETFLGSNRLKNTALTLRGRVSPFVFNQF